MMRCTCGSVIGRRSSGGSKLATLRVRSGSTRAGRLGGGPSDPKPAPWGHEDQPTPPSQSGSNGTSLLRHGVVESSHGRGALEGPVCTTARVSRSRRSGAVGSAVPLRLAALVRREPKALAPPLPEPSATLSRPARHLRHDRKKRDHDDRSQNSARDRQATRSTAVSRSRRYTTVRCQPPMRRWAGKRLPS